MVFNTAPDSYISMRYEYVVVYSSTVSATAAIAAVNDDGSIGRIITISTTAAAAAAAAGGDNGDGDGDGDGSIVGHIIIFFTAAAVNSDGDADGSIGRSIIVSTAATAADNGDG